MSVYVDNASNHYKRMKMCHMIADTLEELHEMARKIGMKKEWFQDDIDHPHYDLSLSRRALAVQYGAIEVSSRELIQIIREQRKDRNSVHHPKKQRPSGMTASSPKRR